MAEVYMAGEIKKCNIRSSNRKNIQSIRKIPRSRNRKERNAIPI